MLKHLVRRYRQHKTHIHNTIARALEEYVGARGIVPINDKLLEVIGAGRKILFHAAYELAIRERLAIVSDVDGQVLLMTNARYRDRLFVRSGLRVSENTAELAAPVVFTTQNHETAVAISPLMQEDDCVLAISEDTVPLEPFAALADIGTESRDDALDFSASATETLGRRDDEVILDKATPDSTPGSTDDILDGDLDWFSLEVGNEAPLGEVLADYRQTLPERGRDPWPVREEAGVNLDFFAEK